MMLAILGLLAKLPFIGSLISSVSKSVVDYHQVTLTAENTREKIEAGLTSRKISLDQREAELNAQAVKNEQGNWITRWIRPGFATPFVIYIWKRVVYDKVIMGDWVHGRTDGLEADMATALSLILVAYFGARGLQYVVREWKKSR